MLLKYNKQRPLNYEPITTEQLLQEIDNGVFDFVAKDNPKRILERNICIRYNGHTIYWCPDYSGRFETLSDSSWDWGHFKRNDTPIPKLPKQIVDINTDKYITI